MPVEQKSWSKLSSIFVDTNGETTVPVSFALKLYSMHVLYSLFHITAHDTAFGGWDYGKGLKKPEYAPQNREPIE